jgi:hypothetical protein
MVHLPNFELESASRSSKAKANANCARLCQTANAVYPHHAPTTNMAISSENANKQHPQFFNESLMLCTLALVGNTPLPESLFLLCHIFAIA